MKLLICAQVVDKEHATLGFFHEWIEALSATAEQVEVIALEVGAYDLPKHVRVHSLGKESGEGRLTYLWRFYTYLIRALFVYKVDTVFYHMGAIYNVLASPFFLFRSFTKTRYYWWKAHGHINWFGRLALCFVDRVYTSTESGFPIATRKRRVIGQAIDTERFKLATDQSNSVPSVIYTGRITPIKQLEMFITCAELLENQYPFSIVGPVADETYAKQLQQASVNTSVSFIPPQAPAELVHYYQSATVFLNTSLTHSLDKTVLEAVLCGCVPVTANRAFEEWLAPEGLFIQNPSPEAYASVVKKLLTSDTTELQAKLRAAVIRQHSLSTFSDRIFSDD